MTLPPEALAAHRDAVAARWSLDAEAVLVASGLPVPIPGTDGHHPVAIHAEHRYLAGLGTPGQVLGYDPRAGWTLFARVATEEERVWEGDTPDLDALRAASGLEDVRDREGLAEWIAARAGDPLAVLGDPDLLTRPRGYGLPAAPAADADLGARLSWQVSLCRRVKDADEIALMRRAAAATRRGHLAAIRSARPGMTEIELRTELEAEFLRGGGDGLAYGSIVAGGRNAAVLHIAPTDRAFADGDLVLIDAGASFGGYMSDVTRTFPVGDGFTPEQRDLYGLVLAVQKDACRKVTPGKEYREIHLEACVDLAQGLVDLGLLRGEAGDLVDRDVHALFFPHGIGHMIGLSTHDVAGYAEGRKRSDRFGLRWLRADLPLETGHVVTIEPGLYFIEALLADPARREALAGDVDWDRVDGLLDFGGIRIEDDVLVTDDGREILTADIPKEPEEIA